MHDLNDLIPDKDTLVVELKFKGEPLLNKDDTPMTIEVYLPHSKDYRLVKHKQADKVIEKGDKKFTSLDYEQLGIEFLAQITTSWNITVGGSSPKLTQKKAQEIYDKFPVIGEQVQEALNKYESFT